MSANKQYIAIDLKSFYASVECVERDLCPLSTNLVVADAERTQKTICLAVSPSLKSYGIGGRPRLFEVIQKVRDINRERRMKTANCRFTGKSFLDNDLKNHPDWEIDFVIAPPRMAYYIEYSKRIYSIYLNYIAPEDIHVYSIDEVFIDVTKYLTVYKMSAHQLARLMINDVLKQTGITATAGIGTNMYLCKVAMDIVAKHIPADKDGVRIAELDEINYRKTLWSHTPLTDFWRVGKGIARTLEAYGIRTMGQLARMSVNREELLYKLFGVNAELLIDHAWGWEPCTIEQVKSYRPETNSLSSSQVLTCPYDYKKAKVVVKEMADAIALDLVDKKLVADQVVLTVGYDTSCLLSAEAAESYKGSIVIDSYGRKMPKPVHGTLNFKKKTSSSKIFMDSLVSLYDKIVDPNLLIRRISIATNHVVPESFLTFEEQKPIQLDVFVDYEEMRKQKEKEKSILKRERTMQETILEIKKRFGKNAILRGLNFDEGATAKSRNEQIGGHKA